MGKLSTFIGLAALTGIGFYVGKKIFEKKKSEEPAHVFESDSEIFVEEKHSTPKEKLQKASLFAVGALKTGTEKFKEGIDEIINSDMVAKGETTVANTKKFAMDTKDKTVSFAKDAKEKTVNLAKDIKEKTVNLAKTAKSEVSEVAEEAGEVIKSEIDSLNDIVASINVAPSEEVESEDNTDAADADSGDSVEADAKEEVSEVTVSSNVTEFPVSSTESSIPAVEPIAGEEKKEDETEEAADDIDSISLDNMDTVSIDTFDFGSSEQL